MIFGRKCINMIDRLVVCILLMLPCICLAQKGQDDQDLQRLVDYMTGSFRSVEQAAEDPNFLDISLKVVRIWRGQEDGYWLYIEQAVAANEEKPYRQRVYRISRLSADLFESTVYAIPEPGRFAGCWSDPLLFAGLAPDSLILRRGCSVILRKSGDAAFSGNTVGRECASDLHGAAYATSEVVITDTLLVSWDRGFDACERQVWGASRGYRFRKIHDHPAE